jgi:type I site-specific restriction endonuclease
VKSVKRLVPPTALALIGDAACQTIKRRLLARGSAADVRRGFLTKDELQLAIQRRALRRPLSTTEVDGTIVERFYQTRAIRRVTDAIEKDHQRKTLLVMATGAGKTRTVIALADLLMRANWAKRTLFLADRVALVRQAINAFNTISILE